MTQDILAGQSDGETRVPGAGLHGQVAGTVSEVALDEGRRQVLAQALADAITYRDPSGFCAAARSIRPGFCDDHAADLDLADAYLALGRVLGIEADR